MTRLSKRSQPYASKPHPQIWRNGPRPKPEEMEDDDDLDESDLWDQYLRLPLGSVEAIELLARIAREEGQ